MGTVDGNSDMTSVSAMVSERKMRVELYSGWWISWEAAVWNWGVFWERLEVRRCHDV